MKRIIPILAATVALVSVAKELALPSVPADLREPALRADYIGAHFWDSADWADTMTVEPGRVAQNVANFLSVFPVMSGDSARRAAADIFTRRALAAGDDRALAASHALEDCLFGAGAMQRDERLYAVFLESMLSAGYPDSLRAQYMLDMTRRNMPGTKAADFAFTTREGKASTLLEFADRPTVVFFYDPDCHNCHEIAEAMADDPVLNVKLIGKRIKVLAVSAVDHDSWRDHGKWLPDSWTDAADDGAIEDDELYSFGSFPSIYLIDSDGTVLLKDCRTRELTEYIADI